MMQPLTAAAVQVRMRLQALAGVQGVKALVGRQRRQLALVAVGALAAEAAGSCEYRAGMPGRLLSAMRASLRCALLLPANCVHMS